MRTKSKTKPIYGYAITDAGFVIKRDEAIVVHTIFYDFAVGRSALSIAQKLNSGSVPENGRKRWTAARVESILRNSFYAERFPNPAERTHYGIVFDTIYEKAIETLEKTKEEQARGANDSGEHGGMI